MQIKEATTAVADRPGSAPGDARTRDRAARSLLEQGPATAAVLASRLGLTPAAVRRHLDALAAEGRVTASERPPYGPVGRRGRGRPARVYALTDAGRSQFTQGYDRLAADALGHLEATLGSAAVADFAERRMTVLLDRHRDSLLAVPVADRPRALAAALTAEGFAASLEPAPSGHGDQLCQHHCPVAHVAARFPQLCEAETAAFADLLGTHVQRLATIGHGDHLCTTYVPHVTSDSATSDSATSDSCTSDSGTTDTSSPGSGGTVHDDHA